MKQLSDDQLFILRQAIVNTISKCERELDDSRDCLEEWMKPILKQQYKILLDLDNNFLKYFTEQNK